MPAPKPPVTPSLVKYVGRATDDALFLNEVLVKMAVERVKDEKSVGGAYDRLDGVMRLKHIMEEVVGLEPTNRIELLPWNLLNRDRDEGKPFPKGIKTQSEMDGLVSRAPPSGPKVKSAAARAADPFSGITNPDGTPFRRTSIDALEKGEKAEVTVGAGDAGGSDE